jgi:hypothetical protein
VLQVVDAQRRRLAERDRAQVPGDLEPASVRLGDPARSCSRVICMYALNDVAPRSAQWVTICRASSASVSACTW